MQSDYNIPENKINTISLGPGHEELAEKAFKKG